MVFFRDKCQCGSGFENFSSSYQIINMHFAILGEVHARNVTESGHKEEKVS